MKTKRTIFTGFLAAALLLAGCAGTGEPSDVTSDETDGAVDESTTQSEEETRYTPDLPDVTFDGYEFKILQRSPEMQWGEVCIWADSENGEPINDAVYKRNVYIESKYDIKIVPVNFTGDIYQGEMKQQFIQSVMSGDQAFDMAMMGVIDASGLATEGYLVDLYTVPNIDLTKEWWDVSVNESLTIMDKLYYGISRMGINDKDDSFVILFHKQLAEELGIESPYQMVRDNRWTFDNFIATAKLAVNDLNGNGQFDDDDRYGYSGFNAEAWNLFYAGGARIAQVGDDGKPEITMVNERSQQLYEKIYTLFNNDNIMYNTQKFPGETLHDVTYQLLSNKQVLFAGAGMIVVQKARAMDDDFGILPYPKLDENQEKYYTILGQTGATAVTIPKTNENLERTGIIIEAMVAESMNTIYPAYYDINLVGKGIRDEESEEMLDLIMDGRGFDIGALYGWGDLSNVLINSLLNKNESLASEFAKNEAAAIAAMQKTIETFEKSNAD